MSDFWLPTGNKKQTEIDVQISALIKFRAEAKRDLNIARYDLIKTEEAVRECQLTLDFLHKKAKIVSFAEFLLIKRNYERLCNIKEKYLSIITRASDDIKAIDKREAELLALREKHKTVILEFIKNER